MKQKQRRIAVVVVLLVFAGLLGFGLIRGLVGGGSETSTVEGVAVLVDRPERSTMEEVLRYPGTLIPRESVNIVSKIPGRVVRIHVAEGDVVNPGTLLVTLDAESVSLQAEQAYAAWQAAEAQLRKAERGVRNEELENTRALVQQAEEDLEVAKRNLDRSKRLYDAGTIPRAKYEEAESAYRGASTTLENAKRSLTMMEEGSTSEDLDAVRSQAEAAKAQYDLAALQLDDADVRADSSGSVARILVDPGNSVGAGTPLVALVTENPIYAQIAIPEKFYGRMIERGRGTQVRVVPAAYQEEEPFVGRVETVAPLIDPESRTFVVEAAIPNTDGRLRPGMYVNTEIVIEMRNEVLVIPEEAVVLRDDRRVVFVVEEGNSEHAMMRSVETGLKSDGLVEIIAGLGAGDRVVIDGNAFLEDGQLVRVLEEP